jgi:Ca2+-binding RTX toxin-like protein
VSSADGGVLDRVLTFNGQMNLVGGLANDTFQFTTGTLAGTIDGRGGTNSLDYSHDGGVAVLVNLHTDAAPDVNGGAAGGFANINRLVGSTAVDTLLGPAGTNLWTITGPNTGKVNNVAFVGVERLVGGPGLDTFKFGPAGSVLGLDGGGGSTAPTNDWLDYSAWTAAVTVNLATGSASGVIGGVEESVRNIQNVIGGAGNDTLIGDAQGNILTGGGGSDLVQAGSGRSLLIGGSGGDTVTGGSGDDIVISGSTTYDTNKTALLRILQEWQRTDQTYAQRIDNLRHGGGDNGSFVLVWGTTVKDDGSPDVLTGGPGLDWFFANLAPGQDTMTDLNNGGPEQVN